MGQIITRRLLICGAPLVAAAVAAPVAAFHQAPDERAAHHLAELKRAIEDREPVEEWLCRDLPGEPCCFILTAFRRGWRDQRGEV